MNLITSTKGSATLLGCTLAFALSVAPALHAAGYTQTNLVASTDAYGAGIVDPSLINAWGIAIRPAGLGGHFWVESNGGGQATSILGTSGAHRCTRTISGW